MAYMRRVRVGETIRLSNLDGLLDIRVAEVHKGRVVLAIIDAAKNVKVETVEVSTETQPVGGQQQVAVTSVPPPAAAPPPCPATAHYQFSSQRCACGDRWPHQ